MIQNFGSSLARWFWLRVSLDITVKCWPWAQSCEDLTETSGSTSRVVQVHSHCWSIGTACWQEASGPHYLDLSLRLAEGPEYMAAVFPQRSLQMIQEIKMEAVTSFMT